MLCGVAACADCRSVPGAARQCPVKVARDHVTLSYVLTPVIDGDATTIHVKVTMQDMQESKGPETDTFVLDMPGEASKETVNPWVNLKAESAGTTIRAVEEPGVKLVYYKPDKPVVISYDLLKDWADRWCIARQFQPVIFPTYFEVFMIRVGAYAAQPRRGGDGELQLECLADWMDTGDELWCGQRCGLALPELYRDARGDGAGAVCRWRFQVAQVQGGRARRGVGDSRKVVVFG